MIIEVLALVADLAVDGASVAVFIFFGFYWRSWFYILYGALQLRSRLRDWWDSRGASK